MNEAVGTIGERVVAVLRPSASRLHRLAEWFAAEYGGLLRFAYFLTGDAGRAEDLVQEAFVRLYRHDRRIEQEGFKAYARRTILNLQRSWLRRARVERLAAAARHEPSTLAAAEPADHVWRAILALPRRQRACVVLRFYEDLTEQEIATVLGVSTGTVKKHLHRAMASLRAALGEDGQP